MNFNYGLIFYSISSKKKKKKSGKIELERKFLIHIIFLSKGGNSNIAIVYKRLRMSGKITCKFVI